MTRRAAVSPFRINSQPTRSGRSRRWSPRASTDTSRPARSRFLRNGSGRFSHRRLLGIGSFGSPMATAAAPSAPGQTEGRHPSFEAERNLACRYQCDSTARRHSSLPARGHRQPLTSNPGVEGLGIVRPVGNRRDPADRVRSNRRDDCPTLLADGGVENYNSAVDEIVETGRLRRLLAMTEITFSNSLIERWWRTLKHQWLFMNTLDSVAAVERLFGFYVTQHNEQLPHSGAGRSTPLTVR